LTRDRDLIKIPGIELTCNCTCTQDGITAAKRVMRHMPLGCDRNHDRYWFFPAAAPGLYIEKGQSITCTTAVTLHNLTQCLC